MALHAIVRNVYKIASCHECGRSVNGGDGSLVECDGRTYCQSHAPKEKS